MVDKYRMEYTVNSYEVDCTRRLRLSAFLRLLQEAAGRHLDGDGMTYEAMRDAGFVFLLMQERLLLTRRPAYDEKIAVETWCRRVRGAEFIRDVRFLDADGVLAQAETAWVLVDPEKHRILRPGVFPRPFTQLPEKTDAALKKPALPDSMEEVGTKIVRFSDIDCNDHLNNAVYADIVCDFFPGGMRGLEPEDFSISYLGEAGEGEEITVHAAAQPAAEGKTAAVFEGRVGDRRCFFASLLCRREERG